MTQQFQKFSWKENPFVLRVDPKLFTGYEEQVKAALNHIDNKHKIAILTGHTGSGKTNFLKWLESSLDKTNRIYISKPPKHPEEFIDIFTEIFGQNLFEKIFKKKPSLYTLPKYINEKVRGQQIIFMVDEAHETDKEVLEWLRVLVDQIENVSLILAGLPVLESKIKEQLETLDQRITSRITLTALSESETRELIRKRIESVGGTGIKPFTESAIAIIYQRTGGFPREVLKMCGRLISEAIEKNWDQIEAANIEETKIAPPEPIALEPPAVTFSPKPPSDDQIKNLPSKQRQILEALSKADWQTPTEIVEKLDASKYATKEHAIRSINNILVRLMREGFVIRESRGKAFIYALTPKVRTIFVRS